MQSMHSMQITNAKPNNTHLDALLASPRAVAVLLSAKALLDAVRGGQVARLAADD